MPEGSEGCLLTNSGFIDGFLEGGLDSAGRDRFFFIILGSEEKIRGSSGHPIIAKQTECAVCKDTEPILVPFAFLYAYAHVLTVDVGQLEADYFTCS